MTVLSKDIHEFASNDFGTFGELQNDAAVRAPNIMLVACSDQGAAPHNLSFADTSQLYIVQKMAATIPLPGDSHGLTAQASIESAIGLYQVQHVILCGHLGCNIIRHWLRSQTDAEGDGDVSAFNRQARHVVDSVYSELTADERIEAAIREHTLFQVENLQSHKIVRDRLDRGQLRLHAWIVDDESARVEAYEPSSGQFQALRVGEP